MSRRWTEQQVAADAQLESAILAAVAAFGKSDTPIEFLGDWVVIAELPILDGDDDGPSSQYAVLFSGSRIPRHRALGLVAAADEYLANQED